MRDSWEREDCKDCRCCVRNCESVERLSEMRRREAVSLAILKWDVHCEMSWVVSMWVCFKDGEGVRRRGLHREAF